MFSLGFGAFAWLFQQQHQQPAPPQQNNQSATGHPPHHPFDTFQIPEHWLNPEFPPPNREVFAYFDRHQNYHHVIKRLVFRLVRLYQPVLAGDITEWIVQDEQNPANLLAMLHTYAAVRKHGHSNWIEERQPNVRGRISDAITALGGLDKPLDHMAMTGLDQTQRKAKISKRVTYAVALDYPRLCHEVGQLIAQLDMRAIPIIGHKVSLRAKAHEAFMQLQQMGTLTRDNALDPNCSFLPEPILKSWSIFLASIIFSNSENLKRSTFNFKKQKTFFSSRDSIQV